MPNAVDITGERYGQLVAIRPTGKRTKGGGIVWLFRCDCGNEKEIPANSVRSGLVKSCGCIYRPHGETRSRLHVIWCDMRYRCENPNADKKNVYGNRGIAVCQEWHDYKTFRSWALANGYRDDLSIDRIDVNKGYSPDNCRWATTKEQARNTRKTRRVTINGETKLLIDWCEEYGISPCTVYRRVRKYKMPFDTAITIPPIKVRNKYISAWTEAWDGC